MPPKARIPVKSGPPPISQRPKERERRLQMIKERVDARRDARHQQFRDQQGPRVTAPLHASLRRARSRIEYKNRSAQRRRTATDALKSDAAGYRMLVRDGSKDDVRRILNDPEFKEGKLYYPRVPSDPDGFRPIIHNLPPKRYRDAVSMGNSLNFQTNNIHALRQPRMFAEENAAVRGAIGQTGAPREIQALIGEYAGGLPSEAYHVTRRPGYVRRRKVPRQQLDM